MKMTFDSSSGSFLSKEGLYLCRHFVVKVIGRVSRFSLEVYKNLKQGNIAAERLRPYVVKIRGYFFDLTFSQAAYLNKLGIRGEFSLDICVMQPILRPCKSK